ncbi:MAG: 6,7-dimethyl-8-ribityllumazine synthase [Crocinitomicaceae bacterium]|jgi:6,7-dimethyl-8-ribityllumazine synthase|nr:6,7-dimethyl-8-ribityllumazine synthase [Crocinitomicaceae bacterium]MDG1658532.1 6,7-dimethyl-8-ribityllumazine synthase [Crocinitomicaceae bacterium]MDG2440242.1 6,7-dimethyl-8-ribityllumazine synthase [Crocinitomicaceae bacterium]
MATVNRNLSEYNKEEIPNGADFKIGIVVSEWNEKITFNLLKGAKQALLDNGVKEENIDVRLVPGAYELPLGAQFFCESDGVDGVVAIGVVIQGETKHFDFVCEGASQGLMNVNLKYNIPVAFCVLTDEYEQQSIDRSGGVHGNKGIECAVACMKMIALKRSF